ncbi:ComEA family DNA-binding protein [Legionella rowbothamii]|uniref:ComEA family DNA-binding protein n=1 Tax=Legionella rowbothamii TaxID=96229 RepID=UPI001055BB64|nr:helix-hairpin-helix domain-containing protein [Legionella rowbothamii]
MKAQILAAALSLLAVNLAAHAGTTHSVNPEKQTSLASKKIDLNKADVSSLIGSFKGIGKKRAEAIIAYRTSHQGFKSIEELSEVKGIGQRFVTANKEKLNEIFVIN